MFVRLLVFAYFRVCLYLCLLFVAPFVYLYVYVRLFICLFLLFNLSVLKDIVLQ